MRIGVTILSLLLVGLSLAAQTTANVLSGARDRGPLLAQSGAGAGNGPALRDEAAGDTLHVDLDVFNQGLGLSNGGIFYAAARLNPTKACTVASVVFYKWDASIDDYLFVWGKGTDTTPGQLLESVPYSGAAAKAWQTVNLPILVKLTGATDDIWVGPRINHSGGSHPLGVDDGPTVAKRSWINGGGGWVQLSSAGYNVNWHIRALLGHGGVPVHDVGAELVFVPKDTVAPGPVVPKARIRNFGANPVSGIPLTCRIDSLDSASTTVFTSTTLYADMLSPSETADVTFPDTWTGVVGSSYQVVVFTSLPGDSNFVNDTAYASVTIHSQSGVDEAGAKLGGSIDNVTPSLARDRVYISFTVARRGNVKLGVYDAAGSLIRTLVDGTLEPGACSATWDRTASDGRRVANGTYFYRLTVGGRTVSRKSVLLN